MVLPIDHDLLRERVRDFISKEAKIADLRALRDTRKGFDSTLWASIVALGWPGILFPEDMGGQGLGYSVLGIVVNELGRNLTPTPFLSTVVLAGQAIRLGGSEVQQAATLPDVLLGRRFLAFAHQEGPVFRPYDVRLSAEPTEGGYVLRGSKTFVLDAHVAHLLVTVARTSGAPGEREGLSLFLVDADASGVRVVPGLLLDSRVAEAFGSRMSRSVRIKSSENVITVRRSWIKFSRGVPPCWLRRCWAGSKSASHGRLRTYENALSSASRLGPSKLSSIARPIGVAKSS